MQYDHSHGIFHKSDTPPPNTKKKVTLLKSAMKEGPNCLFCKQMNDIDSAYTTGINTCPVFRKAINTVPKQSSYSQTWPIAKQLKAYSIRRHLEI